LSWIERWTPTPKARGSNPPGRTKRPAVRQSAAGRFLSKNRFSPSPPHPAFRRGPGACALFELPKKFLLKTGKPPNSPPAGRKQLTSAQRYVILNTVNDSLQSGRLLVGLLPVMRARPTPQLLGSGIAGRSEEHTSELQSR